MIRAERMSARRRFDLAERRARIARRHRLVPQHFASDAVQVAGELVGLHASDPATVFLAARARVAGFAAADLEAALYEREEACKHLAMRRTLFVLPRDLLPTVQAACTDIVAAAERRRLAREAESGGASGDGARWLARAERAALRTLAARGEATTAELSRDVRELQASVRFGEGKSWGGEARLAGRVLGLLAAEGKIVRGRHEGTWTSNRHRWRPAAAPVPAGPPPAEAQADLVRRWLRTFGPATEADVAWWTGLGVTRIRAALSAVEAVEVALDGGAGGVALPDDLDPTEPVDPWAALLPGLDPATMGWKRRDWYLGPHAGALFDANGNAGPTVWVDGRIVGGWVQRRDGEIAYGLLEDVGTDAVAAVEREAERLAAWLGDVRLAARFPTRFLRALAG